MRSRVTVALLAVAVVGGGLLADRIDTDLPVDRPIVLPGGEGSVVPIGQGTVTVHGAAAAESVEVDGERLETRGRWIVVEVSLQGRSGPIDDLSWWLEDTAGRRFEATDRVDVDLPQAQPGMSLRGPVVFEVAPDVELSEATIVMTVDRYRQETAIRVPIEQEESVLTVTQPEREELP
ncbi:DUF4352 domain-containing protein [Microbacterium sp. Marseille-Q6965]|uniref:DUF4352 domain-containing protein n=1 Tax=Microbacterium sp. Marseille-Q6965 TaxID=2965072 RepID=UPI0021B7D2F8|nr:DUF4352 domain-containing protein [Microbacterium sp. Marseille-Q6965]